MGELPRDRVSFGYNQAEDEAQSLNGYQLAQHLMDGDDTVRQVLGHRLPSSDCASSSAWL